MDWPNTNLCFLWINLKQFYEIHLNAFINLPYEIININSLTFRSTWFYWSIWNLSLVFLTSLTWLKRKELDLLKNKFFSTTIHVLYIITVLQLMLIWKSKGNSPVTSQKKITYPVLFTTLFEFGVLWTLPVGLLVIPTFFLLHLFKEKILH